MIDAGRDPARIAASARCRDGARTGPDDLRRWWADALQRTRMTVERVPLARLDRWRLDPDAGTLAHADGGFFRVVGLEVDRPDGPVPRWGQPIIEQPEVGILGLLVREFDGVLHCLVQAKAEPGNRGGAQVAPTVQATRSNYTRVHRGGPVRYLELFQDARRRALVDVRQSEHGAWFYRKRNRNMVVETTDAVDPAPGFCWLTLGQLHRLLARDDLVNMDLRSVLACLPFAAPGAGPEAGAAATSRGSGFRDALARSCDARAPARHTEDEILHWITEIRTRTELRTRRVPLGELRDWRTDGTAITHRDGRYFDIGGVSVVASGREVRRWSQPLLRPRSGGVAAFVVTSFEGVLHVLVRAQVEPGLVDVAELAPTVRCAPADLAHLPASARPPFVDDVLGAGPERIRYAAVQSEDGGRLDHARARHLIVDADPRVRYDGRPDFRWMTLAQLASLLRHSHYVCMQARSLVACLLSLAADPSPARPEGRPR
ncbi:NDP-hexose 2,3-dehydratase family protein [Spirillospora sp. NPDC052242]